MILCFYWLFFLAKWLYDPCVEERLSTGLTFYNHVLRRGRGDYVDEGKVLINDHRELCFVGSEEEVRKEHRKVVKVQGREIVVFAIRDTYYALDRQCYRELWLIHSDRNRYREGCYVFMR